MYVCNVICKYVENATDTENHLSQNGTRSMSNSLNSEDEILNHLQRHHKY